MIVQLSKSVVRCVKHLATIGFHLHICKNPGAKGALKVASALRDLPKNFTH